ncbi:MAG: flagellar export chaperone FliS [Fibrobacter sp.]|nr:flagellar export chaperone FliS [Fibrobacter sp.]
MKQGYSAYKSTNVETADQGRLIIIAYDVAITQCKMAVEKFDDRHLIEQRTKHLLKAQDAISELLSSLRLDVGEIAHNLYRLYDYMLRSLVEANIKSKKEKVIEVIGYLEDLRSAWAEAIIKTKQEKASNLKFQDMAV